MPFTRFSLIAWLLSYMLFSTAHAQDTNITWGEETFFYDNHILKFDLPTSFNGSISIRRDDALGMVVIFWQETLDFTRCDDGDKACALAQIPQALQKNATWLKAGDVEILHYMKDFYPKNLRRRISSATLFFLNKAPVSFTVSYPYEGEHSDKQAIAERIINSLTITTPK